MNVYVVLWHWLDNSSTVDGVFTTLEAAEQRKRERTAEHVRSTDPHYAWHEKWEVVGCVVRDDPAGLSILDEPFDGSDPLDRPRVP